MAVTYTCRSITSEDLVRPRTIRCKETGCRDTVFSEYFDFYLPVCFHQLSSTSSLRLSVYWYMQDKQAKTDNFLAKQFSSLCRELDNIHLIVVIKPETKIYIEWELI